MTQLRERSASATWPMPHEVLGSRSERAGGRTAWMLRTIGAMAVLVTGAVHLQQYLYWPPLPIISPLFVLNFAGATVIGLGLLIPWARLRLVHALLALGGIGLAATSIVFLLISEHQPLFGFQEHGYRAAIVIALAAEAVAVISLAAYLATHSRRSISALTFVGILVLVLAVGSTAPAAASTPGTWQKTGSMTTPREGQTAVVLANGQVLVMGGSNESGALSSAELFNPATGKFTATGNMGAARTLFTATALPNGEALVTGGAVAGSVTSSAELFNPSTGTFSPTGSMTTPRERGTATLLQNGQVLVAGGDNSSGDLASAELYNPGTGTFSPTGSMNVARPTANATLLPNGQVLVAGGSTCCNNLCCSGGLAELYNPATGVFTNTGEMSFPRYGPLAGLLPDGQVLEICNIADPGVPRCGAELYNPASGTWSQDGAASPSAEAAYAYAMLNNGEVLISGGANTFGSDSRRRTVLQSGATLFDPTTGQTTLTGNMSTPREDHSLTLLPNGQMLAAGGYTQSNSQVNPKISVTASAELFTP